MEDDARALSRWSDGRLKGGLNLAIKVRGGDELLVGLAVGWRQRTTPTMHSPESSLDGSSGIKCRPNSIHFNMLPANPGRNHLARFTVTVLVALWGVAEPLAVHQRIRALKHSSWNI
ncbi:hypothetical protein G6O67_005019 [Ophiocordyceps sinensis]|uniref:Uncharacterized protein n=1 Tax=Ophiocordyceps sinensis TaxID=72228 RepID=A0A8H4V5I5_9HYPO|nr:hypothetical protein G6O67_005019 [Ophiocordyceps sinensis]